MAGHQRTAGTPVGGGRADTPAGGRQAGIPAGAILRMGIHAYAMGERGYGGSPNAEAGEDVSTAQQIYIYIYIYIHVHTYIYIYIHISNHFWIQDPCIMRGYCIVQ
jgi:hypothetical protein